MYRDQFRISLWLVALSLACDPNHDDPFPAELDELAERYFARFPPAARA